VLLLSEPNAEAALTVSEHGLGWVVGPGNPEQLAQTIRLASRSEDPSRAERAAVIARRYNFADAMAGYADLMQKLLREAE
jgi:colanic acid biosynthesis glycosyl transferase WcaI